MPLFTPAKPYIPLHVTKPDTVLASLLMGFFAGFGFYVVVHAIQETRRAKRFTNPYILLIWGEILACIVYGLLSYLYLLDIIEATFFLFFGIWVAWTAQIHCLLQIITNRAGILFLPQLRKYLKICVVVPWILICTSVFFIWINADLQVSKRWEIINLYWDRTQKILYLLTDATLNYIFIRKVKTRLIKFGLTKYDSLVKFNQYIMIISLFMDCAIIGLMSYPNQFVYLQVHPVAYIVKLDIEIKMSRLIIRVATSTGLTEYGLTSSDISRSIPPVEFRVESTNYEDSDRDECYQLGAIKTLASGRDPPENNNIEDVTSDGKSC